MTGASAFDRDWEARIRGEIHRFEGRLTVEYLSGPSMAAAQKRLGELKADTIVFVPVFFQDAENRFFIPRESIQLLASASTAPVYAPYNTYIGTGIVGGRMPVY